MSIKRGNNAVLENEASLFAMLLLMPESLFKEDMKQPFDLSDNKFIKSLADKYEVPENAVVARIIHYSKYKH